MYFILSITCIYIVLPCNGGNNASDGRAEAKEIVKDLNITTMSFFSVRHYLQAEDI
jgi:hypothetical protein